MSDNVTLTVNPSTDDVTLTVTDAAGMPAGGTAGQVLSKIDGTNYNAQWSNAGGVSDGDKGDLTVSGSGTVWTLDANVVTNAKSAQVATATFKGRTTAGTGNVEDLSVAQAKTLLGISGTNTGDQTADTTPNTPAGTIVATTMQAAINELDTDVIAARASAIFQSTVNAIFA